MGGGAVAGIVIGCAAACLCGSVLVYRATRPSHSERPFGGAGVGRYQALTNNSIPEAASVQGYQGNGARYQVQQVTQVTDSHTGAKAYVVASGNVN